jgi:epoxyqueuosine reductase QueG
MKPHLFQNKLKDEIKLQGADFMHFVDISHLPKEQNKGFPIAILVGIVLSRDYLKKVASVPDYVEQMKKNNTIKSDEFHLTELKTDRIADNIEAYITSAGFNAYSQSEDNILKTVYYNKEQRSTPLPHKTVAVYAGMGWIGKHNLLVTPEYGSAISMCTVLTDAPLNSAFHQPLESICGDCVVCQNICKPNAIKGKIWECGMSRDEIVDVFLCTTCLQCLVHCPWTQKYIRICIP